MVILDNSTRWNSSFYSIQRGLLLKNAIKSFISKHEDDLADDLLTEDDWATL